MFKITFALSLAALAGCAPSGENRPVNLANPASVYCEKLGGQSRIERRPGGEIGICMLPGGEEIEEWKLYRRDHPA